MSFKVTVLLDSISPPTNDHPNGVRLTTFKTQFPREILAEINTHTILSKSASSSRAIPGQRMRDFIKENLYIPEFGTNKHGMQAGPPLQGDEFFHAEKTWESAAYAACDYAADLDKLGVHKQVANRLVENFGWTNQVITGTDWANFFALRTHQDAHPAFRTLARAMWIASTRSVPRRLGYGEYHMPFVGQGSINELLEIIPDTLRGNEIQLLESKGFDYFTSPWYRSVACCARVSYETVDGTPGNLAKDFAVYSHLSRAVPKHVSPFQHQATPWHPAQEASNPHMRSNLRGWLQYRKTIKDENITTFSPSDEDVAAWGIDEAIFTD